MSGQEDANDSRRRYGTPYTPRHTIPTIQKYREEKEARQARAGGDEDEVEDSRTEQLKDSARDYWRSDKDSDKAQEGGEDEQDVEDFKDEQPMVDTSQTDPNAGDPKAQRKGMKKRRRDERAEREVTDPVTHLPVTIHDFTSAALKETPENDEPMGSTARSATGLSNRSKSNKQLQKERYEMEQGRESMQSLFPPPEYGAIKQQLADVNKLGVTFGLAGVAAILAFAVGMERLLRLEKLPHAKATQEGARWFMSLAVWLVLSLLTVGGIWTLIVGVRNWMANKLDDIWDDQIWAANRAAGERTSKAHETESVAWLNSLLASVWPLVNPDLFTSVADTLEDVMQASLPSMVQMVSVDDVGQGSESIRILGVRWLPTGAAARGVESDGSLESADKSKRQNDRTASGEGEVDDSVEGNDDGGKNNNSNGDKKSEREQGDDGAQKEIAEGMEAEEGDFINLEVSFAYRPRSTLKDRTKDMHLYIAFYLFGNLFIPVWVDLRGIVGSMRLRLQLAPDPPFFALCTLTFLGQPKVDISAVPLVKKGMNIMDLPLISNFVQSSVDAAMAEYVAPKSLTLDLKDMLAGDDFKKDTSARGILVVHIKRGYDFTMGDAGIPLIKDGSADPYVSVGWAKFGKALWSTRILMSEMEPRWDETTYLLVTPEEVNVDERLRVQLWDSDRFTADDDLGRIEVDLKKLMTDEASSGKMQDRKDSFRALKAGEDMPGMLEWSVGYFSKTRIQPCQLQQQSYDPETRSMKQLEEKVDRVVEDKLREANIKEGREQRDKDEMKQQKAQEMKARQDAMIISAPPPQGFPSGVFSLQIHQITGLELEKLSKKSADKDSEAYENTETGEGLPSAYCTIIINHKKVFKTRTKPKNAKPFYNAGIERFIPDWRTAEVHVSVRDARWKEDDALLGIVHLPLSQVFKERSQINGQYPLMGGIGFGRVRLSMVFRSVQLQAPPRDLGWQFGTLEIQSGASSSDLPHDLQGTKMRFHTDIGYGKMYASKDGHSWHGRHERNVILPVKKRYASCLAIEFRKHGMTSDKTTAFAVLWLCEIPDEDGQELKLDVWTGDFQRAKKTCMGQQCGEKIGSINLKLTFWSGLGGAHSQWANKQDSNMHDVIEVLQVSRDNDETRKTAKQAGIVDEDSTSTSDGADSSDDEGSQQRPDGEIRPLEEQTSNEQTDDTKTEDDEDGKSGKSGKRNILDTAKDYKKQMKSEHRRNRGLMQWKIPRTANWGKHKAEHTASRVASVFKHHSRESGIETEA